MAAPASSERSAPDTDRLAPGFNERTAPDAGRLTPRSTVWATNIDVLPPGRTVERRDGYLVVRSPENPVHWWGNLLIFDEPPAAGDGPAWEALFETEFAGDPGVRHRTFAWDRIDGTLGAAREEFKARGYELDESVGLIATPEQIRAHPRANAEVSVRALDPCGDERYWKAVVEVQVAGWNERPEPAETHRAFAQARIDTLRAMFRAGAGSWYVALWPETDAVVASCGVLVTGPRGRFQTVDTAEAFRRRGICSRLVAEAAHDAAARFGAERLVIVADVHYHALGIYESLGFERAEFVCGVCRPPGPGQATVQASLPCSSAAS